MTEFTDFLDLPDTPTPTDAEICKGLIYRASVDNFVSPADGSIVFRERLRPLKKKSCTGCARCDCISDDLTEFIGNDHPPYAVDLKGSPCSLENGKLYSLQIGNESRDWESGQIDDYDLILYEVKE